MCILMVYNNAVIRKNIRISLLLQNRYCINIFYHMKPAYNLFITFSDALPAMQEVWKQFAQKIVPLLWGFIWTKYYTFFTKLKCIVFQFVRLSSWSKNCPINYNNDTISAVYEDWFVNSESRWNSDESILPKTPKLALQF